MYSFLYMLARTTLTYTLFRTTRGALNYGMKQINSFEQSLKCWRCPNCGRWFSSDRDVPGRIPCPRCNTPMTKKYKSYIQEHQTNEAEEVAATATL